MKHLALFSLLIAGSLFLVAESRSPTKSTPTCAGKWQHCVDSGDCGRNGCCIAFHDAISARCCVPKQYLSYFAPRGRCLPSTANSEDNQQQIQQPQRPRVCPRPPRPIPGVAHTCPKLPIVSECRRDFDCQIRSPSTPNCCTVYHGFGCYGGKKCM